ncbi:MAG: hypothetical protein QM820_24750 [Minicystis sp.]
MSILVAMVAIPLLSARDPRPARGARRAAVRITVFVVVWAYAVLHLYSALKK